MNLFKFLACSTVKSPSLIQTQAKAEKNKHLQCFFTIANRGEPSCIHFCAVSCLTSVYMGL